MAISSAKPARAAKPASQSVWIAAIAEFVGTAILVTVIVGSGIMATHLTRDVGVALLLNDVATVLVLGLLIWILGSTSGAHFNPVVSLIMTLRKAISAGTLLAFVVAQILGGVVGAIVANTMYARAAISVSHTVRGGSGQLLAEVVATAGLVAIICIGVDRGQSGHLKSAVPAWIASAYVFTSSTSFANPAVTIGRIFSDSFAGISPHSISGFIAAQCVGAFIGFAGARALARTPTRRSNMSDYKATVLFVCIHNAGRSQMAAGFLQHLAGDRVQVLSAGTAPKSEVNPSAIAVMAELGIDLATSTPKVLTDAAVQASDYVITMGCGDECPFYPGKTYLDWPLADPAGKSSDDVRPIRDEIRAKVEALIAEIDAR